MLASNSDIFVLLHYKLYIPIFFSEKDMHGGNAECIPVQ